MLFTTIVIAVMATTANAMSQETGMILMRHNHERELVGVDPLKWDVDLAMSASNYAKQCKKEHSMLPNIGENLAWGMPFMSMEMAMNLWINEKEFLMEDGKTCMEDKVCGHYLQIIKEKNSKIGCGTAECWGNYNYHVCHFARTSTCRDECREIRSKSMRKKCRRKCKGALQKMDNVILYKTKEP